MEQIIAEFKAKSLYFDSVECGVFFPWDLYERGRRLGVVIDIHALIDPERSAVEGVKLVYLCFNAYVETARSLGLETKDAPTLNEIKGWAMVKPDEFAKAIIYASEQLSERAKENESKKKDQTNVS